MLALVDGDIIVYRSGFSVEKTHYFVWTSEDTKEAFPSRKEAIAAAKGDESLISTYKEVQPLAHALQAAKYIINAILTSLKTKEYRLFLTSEDKSNFRYKIAKTQEYKGHRKAAPRPKHYKAIREYLINNWSAEVVYGQEADDALSIAQYEYIGDCCIASIDKDLDMVPGKHYNFVKDKKYRISHEQGMRNFYSQMLMGDSADNIPGIYGIGPKTAAKLLAEAKTDLEMYQTVKKEYTRHLPKDEVDSRILEVGQLLWMRTCEEELWQPPT